MSGVMLSVVFAMWKYGTDTLGILDQINRPRGGMPISRLDHSDTAGGHQSRSSARCQSRTGLQRRLGPGIQEERGQCRITESAAVHIGFCNRKDTANLDWRRNRQKAASGAVLRVSGGLPAMQSRQRKPERKMPGICCNWAADAGRQVAVSEQVAPKDQRWPAADWCQVLLVSC